MSNGLITVVTPTFGHSAWRLEIFFRELRKFTQVPFRHIVCDDGTIREWSVQTQREVCTAYGAEHFVNPGPYGVSYNLNYILEQVKTPWVFLLEDGLRPSLGWLETAMRYIEQIDGKEFGGRQIGMVGTSHIQDWMLAMAGAIPTRRTVMEFFIQNARGDDFYGEWNDGLWCWNRMLPGIKRTCSGDTSDWSDELVVVRQIVLEDLDTTGRMIINPRTGQPWPPVEQNMLRLKFRTKNRFPDSRGSEVAWYPGACALINVEKWKHVGRFRNGCTFFEGHLGLRMGIHGFLSVALEFPPWLHAPSLGFAASRLGKGPRVHVDTTDIFRQDFGGRNHVEALELVSVPWDEINKMLAEIETKVVEGWKTC